MSGGRLIPVLNAGSSSLKFAPLEVGAASKAAPRSEIEDLDSTPHLEARNSKGAELTAKRRPTSAPEDFAEGLDLLSTFTDELRREDSLLAVGPVVAHGGTRHIAPERLMAESFTALEAPTLLDPLHPPRALTTARHTEALLRGAAQ